MAALLDDWIDRVSRATASGDPPSSSTRLEPDDLAAVEAGRPVTPRSRVLWVRQGDADLAFLGSIHVAPCDHGSRFPLSPHAWASAEGPAALRPCDTESLIENGDPWLGLRRFHRAVLDALAASRDEAEASALARRALAARRDEARMAESVALLARPSGPSPRSRRRTPGDEAPRVAACRAVAESLGCDAAAPVPDGAPLPQVARSLGLLTRRVRLPLGWWRAEGGPLLAARGDEARPVALLPGPGGRYTIVDPSDGTEGPLTEASARSIGASAVAFYRTLRIERPSLGELFRFALPTFRKELRIVLVLGLVAGLLGLVLPYASAVAIDDAIPRADRRRLGVLCGFLVAIGTAVALFQAIQGLAMARVRARLESDLLPAVWDRLLNLPARFFSGYESGDLALRAMGLANAVGVMATTPLVSMLVGAFSLLNLAALFAIDGRMALVAVALIALSPVATLLAMRPLGRLRHEIARSQGEIAGLLVPMLGGIARLRVAGAEGRAFARWAEKYRRQLGLMLEFQGLADRLALFQDAWPLVLLMAVLASASLLGEGTLSVGQFLAFNLALGQGVGAVLGLGRSASALLDAREQYRRFAPILEAAPEGIEGPSEAVVLGGSIRLGDVSFRYSEDGPLVLDKVDIQARPGEFVAIVGPSGSGKSTLLRLLLGFEAPSEGVVAYDGRELATLDARDVRRQVGTVLQDAQLTPGDLLTNIVGLSSGLGHAEAMEAARLAGLADDIEQMPMGLHTLVGESGGGLSSGQRQRLLIARAVVGRPRVLLFDEATSALDNRTQQHVARGLRDGLRGTTRVVIAHRLSTIVEADRIYVLAGGKVVQAGTYSQMIRVPGAFRDLARRQQLIPESL